jgi:hypothetical protein
MKATAEKPIVNGRFILERYPGKGGWTYLTLPKVSSRKKRHFGWVIVKGSIDDFPISNFKLWPTKNGGMFMPVKAQIRKKILKKEGDSVKVLLFPDEGPAEIPLEFLECLRDEPRAEKAFMDLDEDTQRTMCEQIVSATSDAVRVKRIAETMNKLLKRSSSPVK